MLSIPMFQCEILNFLNMNKRNDTKMLEDKYKPVTKII